jgi:hypothetical protein
MLKSSLTIQPFQSAFHQSRNTHHHGMSFCFQPQAKRVPSILQSPILGTQPETPNKTPAVCSSRLALPRMAQHGDSRKDEPRRLDEQPPWSEPAQLDSQTNPDNYPGKPHGSDENPESRFKGF